MNKKQFKNFKGINRIYYAFCLLFFSSSIRIEQIAIQITAENTQKAIAPFQPNLSTIKPVPDADKTAPIYPKVPVKPVAADATFLELDSTAQSPPIII